MKLSEADRARTNGHARFMVAVQAHNEAVASLAEGAEASTPPVAPVPPSAATKVKVCAFLAVFLYLRNLGILVQARSSFLRSSRGSLTFDKVSELWRKIELDALVASKTTPSSHTTSPMSRSGKTSTKSMTRRPTTSRTKDKAEDLAYFAV